MTDFTKRYLRGWRMDSQRHALAARGIRTRYKSPSELQRELMMAKQRIREAKDVRAQHSVYLNVLSQYLRHQRTGRGPGSMYSYADAEDAYKKLVATGDPVLLRQATKDFDKIKKYHAKGWVPPFKPTRSEIRVLRKGEILAKKEKQRAMKEEKKQLKKQTKEEEKQYEKLLKKMQSSKGVRKYELAE